MKDLPITAIIPAAGKSTNSLIPNSNLSDTMIPINGKPIIGYIMEDLINRGIKDVVVVLSKDDNLTEEYLIKKFKTKLNTSIILNANSEKGIGYSILLASQQVKTGNKIFIYLGDTIYKGRLSFKDNFLVVSKKYEESDKWCFVEEEENKLVFINKPRKYSGSGKVLCGLYFLTDEKLLKEVCKDLEKSMDHFEIKDILEKYSAKYNFSLVDASKWYDCGNIENFYKAKIDFLKHRHFNTITYNNLYGYITKTGINKEKLLQEINWYEKCPDELRIFFPRLINKNITKNKVHYSLEFYGYPSLADLYVFNSLDIRLWNVIIHRLFEIIDIFSRYKTKIPYSAYKKMYVNKTKERLQLMDSPFWENLLSRDTVVINGKEHRNVSPLLEKVEKYIKQLYTTKEMTFIHGDLCMSNILFDLSSRIFKFVDPGGRFGKSGIYGDQKYDIAKLRHSFSGYYDFIMADMFELKENDFELTYTIYNDKDHAYIAKYFDRQIIKNGFNLNSVKLVEGLLFLSMIPLHSESSQRQKIMYCRGIELLNEVFL